jgi:8-oxo-dGTP pyrophosphatase MutT (NUDIX family)
LRAPRASRITAKMSDERREIEQFGVIAWRRGGADGVEILLITSRETRRWVPPRGNAIPGLRPYESAAQEAFEEAGVRGGVQPQEIGTYRYQKRSRDGRVTPAKVHLYPMLVTEEAESWPEQNQRERRWFAPGAAADSVDEADLASLIRDFPHIVTKV